MWSWSWIDEVCCFLPQLRWDVGMCRTSDIPSCYRIFPRCSRGCDFLFKAFGCGSSAIFTIFLQWSRIKKHIVHLLSPLQMKFQQALLINLPWQTLGPEVFWSPEAAVSSSWCESSLSWLNVIHRSRPHLGNGEERHMETIIIRTGFLWHSRCNSVIISVRFWYDSTFYDILWTVNTGCNTPAFSTVVFLVIRTLFHAG